MRRPRLFITVLIAGLAAPNGPAAWVYDRAYDVCMVTAGQDDWTCEDVLVALGE
jgi:hypothetical protein